MKILITGITGFVGSHLAELCLQKSKIHWDVGVDRKLVEVHGIKKWRSNMENIRHIEEQITFHDCDITDSHSVENVVKELKPDIIFHLAAMSFVPHSWTYPQRTMEVNVLGAINFLEAVRKFSPETIIQLSGSSEEFGAPPKDTKGNWIVPMDENTRLAPLSPYGVSKVAQTLLGMQYNKSYGLKTVCTRAFNHSGIRRGEDFICMKIAKQAAEIKLGLRERFKLGNLDARRDITDVRDVVKAYVLAVKSCNYGEVYVIASGKCVSVREIVDIISEVAEISKEVELDPRFLRPSDVPILLGDSSKFRKKTGWKSRIDIRTTLKEMFLWQLEKLKK